MTPFIRLIAAVALVAVAAPPASAADRAMPRPKLAAPSAIAINARTGEVLFTKSPDERRQIASTTKLMTAMLVLDRAKGSDVFTAPAYDALPAESRIGLKRGERLRVSDLLRALLLESANDAAATLAVGVAGSQRAFVREMNTRARELGLDSTHYANPVGLDDPGNYSTARDLARLARVLLRRPRFARIVNLPQATLKSGAHPRTVANRNDLVRRYRFVDGVKTGHTKTAGYVLVGAASGRDTQVVTAALGDPSEGARDADSLALMRYGLDQYRRQPVAAPGRVVARAGVKYFDESAPLGVSRRFAVTVRRGERARLRAVAPAQLEGPIRAGQRVGRVDVLYRGKVVRTLPLVTQKQVPEAGFLAKLFSSFWGPLMALLLLVILAVTVLITLRMRAVRRRRRQRRARAG